MSTHLRTYKCEKTGGLPDMEDLHVTQTCGRVQITINQSYSVLSREQAIDLAAVILTATSSEYRSFWKPLHEGEEEPKAVYADGTIQEDW